MRDAVAIVLTIALVATGLLLARDIAVLVAPGPGLPALEGQSAPTASAAQVRAFYDTANVLLRSGNSRSIGDPLASLTGSPPIDDVVLGHLGDLSRLGVGRLEVEGVVGGQKVLALVAGYPAGAATSPDAGAAVPLWRTIDTLILGAGEIVDFVPGPIPPAAPLPLPAATFAALPGAMAVSLARIELAPGAVLSSFMAPYPHLLLIESGTLTVGTRHHIGLARAGGEAFSRWPTAGSEQSVSLGPGDAITLPEGAKATLRNEGLAPVSAFSLLIVPGAALATPPRDDGNDTFTIVRMHDPTATGQPVPRGDGITTTALTAVPLASASPRSRSIRVETNIVLLEPGAQMTPVTRDRVTMVAVSSGTLSVSGATTWPSMATQRDASPANRLLRGGEAAGFTPDSAPTLQNAAGVTVELRAFEIVVAPDGASPEPG